MINNTERKALISTEKATITTYTHLKEIYCDYQNKREEIEPIYENLRKKFMSTHKSEADIFCRVPYAISLFGDEITKLFDEKIVTTIEKDLITCAKKTKEKTKFTFETYDTFTSPIEIDIIDKNLSFDNHPEYFKYFWAGYESCLRYIKPDSIFGVDILVNLNIVDYDSFSLFPTMFLSGFLIILYLYGKHESVNASMIADIAISEITKLGYKNSTPIIFSQLFLPRKSIGIYTKSIFNFYSFNEGDKYLFFFCDSISKETPTYYSMYNQVNLRLVEVKLGLALILKRYKSKNLLKKEQITVKEICDLTSNLKIFQQYFENNIDTLFGLIDNLLKKSPYKLKDIKEELNFDLKEILKGIANYETVLIKTKEYCLFKRLNGLFREIERIEKISLYFKQLSSSSEQEERRIFEKLITLFKESNNSLKVDYECFNDEINQIENIRQIDKSISEIHNVGNKLISRGWKGTLAFLGEKNNINMINQIVENFFSKLEENETIDLWISDDLKNNIFQSKFGGNACYLNPIYDDFYLFDIYDENIKEIHKNFLERLNILKQEKKTENSNSEIKEEIYNDKNSFDIKF